VNPCSFTPTYNESFESFTPNTYQNSLAVFGGNGNISATVGYIWTTGGWGFIGVSAVAHDGTQGFGNNAPFGSPFNITFYSPAYAFGGYFGYANSGSPMKLTFFDSNHNLLATQYIGYNATAKNGTLQYAGFCANSLPIRTVEIDGLYVALDSLSYKSTPPVTTSVPLTATSSSTTVSTTVSSSTTTTTTTHIATSTSVIPTGHASTTNGTDVSPATKLSLNSFAVAVATILTYFLL
jgi:hypothetical protein